MKVIQLRGTNATGKTTTVRQFILRGRFTVKTITVRKTPVEYCWEEERRIAVIGRYDDRETGGVDGRITNKDLLRDTILRVIKAENPQYLIFEGVVYGVTFQFAYELYLVLKRMGWEYIGLCFIPPLEVAFERLAERNGGKPVDYMSVQNKWFTANSAYRRLLEKGVNVKAVDTSKIPKGEMYKLIEGEL